MTVRHAVRTRKIAMGKKKASNIVTATVFDPPTFHQIRSGAVKQGISFAERVRDLVELGLETERMA